MIEDVTPCFCFLFQNYIAGDVTFCHGKLYKKSRTTMEKRDDKGEIVGHNGFNLSFRRIQMHRDLHQKLIAWKSSHRRKPLILRGARQVGKTHLLREFAAKNYKHVFYLNFDEDPGLKSLFEASLSPDKILGKLAIHFGVKIESKDSIIIFDEIQESPNALNCLKYFNEKANEYHIAAAGSLLGVKLAQTKGFPVGKVNFLDLYPLSFYEFLSAVGKGSLRGLIECNPFHEEIPEVFHEELIEFLKTYSYVGGMPEAVKHYCNEGNIIHIHEIHKEILDAYTLDFSKHAPKNQIMKISDLWQIIPSQLGKENKKFIFSAIAKSARGREYEDALQWLTDAGMILKSQHVSVPRLPLSGYSEKNNFKVFMLDVGLLSTMSKLPAKIILRGHELFTEFKGSLTENFVAQELASRGMKPLYYWSSSGTAEIDFLIEGELKITPLEVKAGTSKQKKSLHVYDSKFNPDFLYRSSLRNFCKNGKVINVPLYAVARLVGDASQ